MKSKRIFFLVGLLWVMAGCNYPGIAKQTPPIENTPVQTARVKTPIAKPTKPSLSKTPIVSPKVTPTRKATSKPVVTSTQEQVMVGEPMPPLEYGQALTITRLTMLDEHTGWGVAQQNADVDYIVRTVDGGETWIDVSPPQLLDPSLNVYWNATTAFLDDDYAWVIYTPQGGFPPPEKSAVWRTMDGGRNWELSSVLPLNGMEGFFAAGYLSFVDPTHGWLLVHVDAGMNHDYSDLFMTEDGGLTWKRIVDPTCENLDSLMLVQSVGMTFADRHWGWVTKRTSGVMPGAFLVQTVDGGYTWKDVFLPSPDEIDWENEIWDCTTQSPVFPDKSEGYLLVVCRDMDGVENTYFYATEDKGATWRYTHLNGNVNQLVFWNENEGLALGSNVLYTEDGGRSWTNLKNMNWAGEFSFVDMETGWAVAQDENKIALVRTDDGGKSWKLIKPIARKK